MLVHFVNNVFNPSAFFHRKSENPEDDGPNISSSNITSTEPAVKSKEETTATPTLRRRGRKRITEPVNTDETASNGDKDKEKENDKEKDNEADKDKEKDKAKEKDKEKEKDKDKEKENDKDSIKQTAEKIKPLDKIKEEPEETSR